MPQVSVIDTRVANIASMCVALERLEAHVELASTAEKIAEAEIVVLPGVGSFAAGMKRITALQIGDAIRNRVKENQPTLAVCLGLQLFCASSAESPNTEGLGIVNAEVERFDSTLKVKSGASTGEGLIYHVRDDTFNSKGELVSPGVEDKRLLIVETEFERVLAAMKRETNSLSAVLRQACEIGRERTTSHHQAR